MIFGTKVNAVAFNHVKICIIVYCVLHVDGCGLKAGLTLSWRQPLGLAALDIQ